MLIDRVYQTVQALMNKDQLGYFKPMVFNLFAADAQRKEYNNYFTALKTNVRKMNWMLDGKDFANMSEHNRQLLEYFSSIAHLTKIPRRTTQGAEIIDSYFITPEDLEFVEDLFIGDTTQDLFISGTPTRIEKVHYKDYLDLLRNIYANPTHCNPIFSLADNKLVVSPNIEKVQLHYLRKPKIPKWTFQEYDGVAYFDSSANDFQDFDLPEASFDNLVSYIAEMAGVSIRDAMVVQSANQEQAQKFQNDNQQ